MLRKYLLCLIIFFGLKVSAQQTITIHVADTLTAAVIANTSITEKNKGLAVTDSAGLISINLSAGKHVLTFSAIGYKEKLLVVMIPGDALLQVYMVAKQQALEEVTVVSSTRNNQKIENAPLKVEVLGREEMDEENTIKPANIASILGDISGIQIQQSSAVSGNANVRIQGLEGRYTQVLRDGMPLYEGFSGGFGILSIPPLDLKQVELIKGSASTLYGGGAIGGLVNIISRKPAFEQQAVLTLNQSTLKESNLNTFIAKRYKKGGYTFFGGFTNQKAVDVNKDDLSDLPNLQSILIHPKFFIYPTQSTVIAFGYTGSIEKRMGGDMQVLNNKADTLHQYFEKNNLNRHTGDLTIETKIANSNLQVKASASSFKRAIITHNHNFEAKQLNYFSEISFLIPHEKNNVVIGINITGDVFKKLVADAEYINNFSNNTLGAFVQYTYTLKEKTVIEAGLRNDYQNNYGNFFLPRLAIFHRFSQHWGSRAGIGAGYKIPNPLTPQIIDYAIENILPLAADVKAEKSTGYNAEVNYKHPWGNGNQFFINHAFFVTQINKPLVATELSNGNVRFSNAAKPLVTKGFDTYIQLKLAGWELYAGYTYTIDERKYLQQNQFVPLTPKTRMASTVVKEWNNKWRIGLEASYNGFQRRFDYTKTPAYFFLAAMVEKKFGKHASVVLNGENLLNYRQSKKETLYTGTITNPQFKPLWAPIDGRVINISVRLKL
jgi:outer membrane receptor for ferrienterochelin and colicins